MLIVPNALSANQLIDAYFEEVEGKRGLFRTVSTELFANQLTDACDHAVGMHNNSSITCYQQTVDEMAAYLKLTLKDRIDDFKSDAKTQLITKLAANRAVKGETAIQHLFDQYYNVACTHEHLTYAYTGTGTIYAELTCQMILLTDRIKLLKSGM
jgi:hypothetical protein